MLLAVEWSARDGEFPKRQGAAGALDSENLATWKEAKGIAGWLGRDCCNCPRIVTVESIRVGTMLLCDSMVMCDYTDFVFKP